MDIHFNISFYQRNSKVDVIKFVNTKEQLFQMKDEDIIELTENLDLHLLFESNTESDRCYFDLLDIVLKNESRELTKYLIPSLEKVEIYSSNSGDYTGALIPGCYKMTVISKDVTYYTWIKIVPKQMTENQLVVMRNEVEEELSGLARDLLYKRVGTTLDKEATLPVSIAQKLNIIEKYFKHWRAASERLLHNPRHTIIRTHTPVDKYEVRIIDNISMRKINLDLKAMGTGKLYTAKNELNHDILENQWIKYFINNIDKKLKNISYILNSYIQKIEEEISLEEKYRRRKPAGLKLKKLNDSLDYFKKSKSKVSNMIYDCNEIMNRPWYKNISSKRLLQKPLALKSDKDYRIIYKIYQELTTDHYNMKLDGTYSYYWKRTDHLYEIWGFIQFIKNLTSKAIDFTVQSGWLYNDLHWKNNQITVPFLDKGTIVSLQRDDIFIKLVYEGTITNDRNSVLYTDLGHKRPDLRLDFYYREEYFKSIIIDFKYRPVNALWTSEYNRNDVMNQLISYRDNLLSKKIYEESLPDMGKNFKAVEEVWAVYPNHKNNKKQVNPNQFRLVELTPGLDQTKFNEFLLNAINRVIGDHRKYEQYMEKK